MHTGPESGRTLDPAPNQQEIPVWVWYHYHAAFAEASCQTCAGMSAIHVLQSEQLWTQHPAMKQCWRSFLIFTIFAWNAVASSQAQTYILQDPEEHMADLRHVWSPEWTSEPTLCKQGTFATPPTCAHFTCAVPGQDRTLLGGASCSYAEQRNKYSILEKLTATTILSAGVYFLQQVVIPFATQRRARDLLISKPSS